MSMPSDLSTGIPAALQTLLGYWGNQIGGTFLSPGSTLSFGALGCTLLVAISCTAPRARSIRSNVLMRALFPRWLTKSRSGRTDIAFFIFSLLFAGFVFGWALLSADQIQAAMAGGLNRLLGSRPPAQASLAIRVAITLGAFVVYEFAYWLDHFISHKLPILWQFHAVHHSAERLSLLTNFRVHPVDTVVFYNMVAVFLGIFLGCVEWALGSDIGILSIGRTNIFIMVSAVALTHLQHSHLWISFGPFWGKWLLSPAHHQIHHSASEDHFDTNFGSSLALWDRLFGTLYLPSRDRMKLRFGIDSLGYDPHHFRGMIVGPVLGAWRSCIGTEPGEAPQRASLPPT
jgi:sterol desaturase/sphingolipid hydroxylase (fatty acid hydroxylase superfamily)